MSVRKLSGITLKGLNISKGAGRLVRRKVDVRTVCIALEVDANASEKMHQTRSLYGQACNLRSVRYGPKRPTLAAVQPAQSCLSDGSNRNARSWFIARLQRHAFGIEHVPGGLATIRNSRRIRRWCSQVSASGIQLFTWTKIPFASSITTPRLRSIR